MYRQIATADAASMAIGFAVGVAAAIARPNAWCLVYMQLAVAVSRTAILALHSDLRPTTLKATGLGTLVRFGRNVVIVQMLDYASRNIDTVLVGKYWGAFDVGIYTRAYQLLMLPLQQVNAPLTRVALPVLSRIKNDRERYTRYVEFAVLVTSTVGMIIFGYLAVCSTDLISVLLGSKWIKAGPIFQAMCFAGVLQAVSYVNYWQFMSLGRTGAHVRYSLIAKPLVVIGFLIAAPHGVTAVAWSYTLTTALVTPIGFWVAGRGQSNASGLSLLVAGCKILPLAATAMIVTAAVRHADLTSNIFLSLLISTVTYVVALGLTTAAIPAYRNLAFSMYALFRDGGRGTGAHSQPQHAASR
jgi:PST family polysaccharide transporter